MGLRLRNSHASPQSAEEPILGGQVSTFAVTFFLATLAALEMQGVRLEDL